MSPLPLADLFSFTHHRSQHYAFFTVSYFNNIFYKKSLLFLSSPSQPTYSIIYRSLAAFLLKRSFNDAAKESHRVDPRVDYFIVAHCLALPLLRCSLSPALPHPNPNRKPQPYVNSLRPSLFLLFFSRKRKNLLLPLVANFSIHLLFRFLFFFILIFCKGLGSGSSSSCLLFFRPSCD